MKYALLVSLVLGIFMPHIAQAELIVLAAPRTGDPYYARVADRIFKFHVAYAKQIETHDNVLILVDKGAYHRYVKALGVDKVLLAPISDIWMRDFATSNALDPMMFSLHERRPRRWKARAA